MNLRKMIFPDNERESAKKKEATVVVKNKDDKHKPILTPELIAEVVQWYLEEFSDGAEYRYVYDVGGHPKTPSETVLFYGKAEYVAEAVEAGGLKLRAAKYLDGKFAAWSDKLHVMLFELSSKVKS